MVDGLLNKKVAFIIQARMQSTRLPGKILMPLPLGSNVPLLGRIVETLKISKTNHTIIVATSINGENNLLETFCKESNVACFRGSEDDVLSRFIDIVKNTDCDLIVRLTADNPFIDAEILDFAIAEHLKSEADYSSTKGLPLGMNLEIISKSALLSLVSKVLSTQDKEHVTLFLRKSGLYKLNIIEGFLKESYGSLRLTVDYPSDYLVASAIFDIHSKTGIRVGLELVDYCIKNFPWIFESNQHNLQKYDCNTLVEEIEVVRPILKQLELNRIFKMLELEAKKNRDESI